MGDTQQPLASEDSMSPHEAKTFALSRLREESTVINDRCDLSRGKRWEIFSERMSAWGKWLKADAPETIPGLLVLPPAPPPPELVPWHPSHREIL